MGVRVHCPNRHLPGPACSPGSLQNKRVFYDLLFQGSAETLLAVARDPRHLGAEIDFFSVLPSIRVNWRSFLANVAAGCGGAAPG